MVDANGIFVEFDIISDSTNLFDDLTHYPWNGGKKRSVLSTRHIDQPSTEMSLTGLLSHGKFSDPSSP